jgi:hypothetical protein
MLFFGVRNMTYFFIGKTYYINKDIMKNNLTAKEIIQKIPRALNTRKYIILQIKKIYNRYNLALI